MTKSIFSENVIKKLTDILPMVGHEIVVYEKNGDRFTFFRHLSENERFEVAPKSLFDRFWNSETTSYVGFAVNMSKHLKSTHSDVFFYDDFNSFDLTYSIEYQVSQVIRLASKVVEAEEDALKKLREIVADEIENKLLRFLPLELISDNQAFTQYVQNIAGIQFLNAAQDNGHSRAIIETYGAINEQAADFGLRVNKINLARRLSEGERERGIKKIESEQARESKIREIQIKADIEKTGQQYIKEANIEKLKHEQELEEIKREAELIKAKYNNLVENIKSEAQVNKARRDIEVENILVEGKINLLPLTNRLELNKGNLHIRKATNEAIEKALLNIGENITTPNGLSSAVRELSGAVFEVFNNLGGGANSAANGGNQNELSGATPKFLLSNLKDKSLTEPVRIVSKIAEILNEANVPADKTRLIMSGVLHLFGELLLAEDAEEDKVELYFRETEKQFRNARQHLSAEHSQQLKSLFELEALKKRFR